MKLKDGLILRKVANQYVIVPIGRRVSEIRNMGYMSASGAFLWDFMKDKEFTKDDLVDRIMEHYTGVTPEQASKDVEDFLSVLKENNVMEPEPGETPVMQGCVHVKNDVPEDKIPEKV